MRGSWNRKPASGDEVVRLRFQRDHPIAFEPFLTGFLVDGGQAHIARPVGLALTRGGALQVLALDAALTVDPGASRDEVVTAAQPHIIAKGRVVGTYQQTDAPLK